MNISISTGGFQRLAARNVRTLNSLRYGQQRAIMDKNAKVLLGEFEKNILAQTPGRVADLSEAYKEVKQKKHGLIYPILFASGGLLRSMRIPVRKDGGAWVFELVFFGKNSDGVDYQTIGNAHLTGDGSAPKRNFARIPRGFGKLVVESIREALRQQRERNA